MMKKYAAKAKKPEFAKAANRMEAMITETNPRVKGNVNFDTEGRTDQMKAQGVRPTVLSTGPALNAADMALQLYGKYQRQEGALGDDADALNKSVFDFEQWLRKNGMSPNRHWAHP